MEVLLVIALIVIVILLFTIRSDFNAHLNGIRYKLNHLDTELQRLKNQLHENPLESKSTTKEAASEIPQPPFAEIKPEPIKVPKEITPPEIQIPKEPELIENPALAAEEEILVAPPAPAQPRKPGFFEQNPDWEKFIGENLANKIGIGILVIGIGFFVKYAIDHSWIAPIGRVMIGVLCGGGLLAIGHRMRNKFRAFSSVLVGGGIAVLYITITIAFQLFQLFEPTVAFAIMVAITAFTIALSIAYDRIELAVLAILGGFGSPFMVSTGNNNYIALFTYITILNVGMLVLAYYKKWNLVNIVCYFFTVILFGSWLAYGFDGNQIEMIRWSLLFSTGFYLSFFGMNIINNIKELRPFKAIDFSMLLSATAFYYAAGMYTLSYPGGKELQGLFTMLLAVFNFGFAYALHRNARVDRNLVFLLIGLTLTFVSLTAPVQLEGNYITIFWAAEAVLLLWLSQKSGIMLMKIASVGVTALMAISLLMDWGNLYFSFPEEITRPVMLNKAYITGLFTIFSLVATLRLLKTEKAVTGSQLSLYKNILVVGAIGLCYLVHLFELQYQLRAFEVSNTAFQIVTGTYNMLVLLIIIAGHRVWPLAEGIRTGLVAIGPFAVLVFLAGYHLEILQARIDMIASETTNTGFLLHYALVLLLVAICAISIRLFRTLTDFNKNSFNLYSWFFVAFFVFLASHELDNLVLLISQATGANYYYVIQQTHKIGWPILWGLGAFLLIFIGLNQKIKHLRIISLVLFLITLLKLFLVDIKGISEAGKIAAFISLGVLLLIISFMYQRLKKLLLDDQPEPPNSENPAA